MSLIAVDIDNTLYSFEQAAREEYLKLARAMDDETLRRGAYNPWTEWRSMTDCCGQEICMRVIERVHSDENIWRYKPYENAVRVLSRLAEEHELLFISNRNEACYRATENWLTDWEFPEGDLVCNLRDKITQVRQCQYMIDDRPKTLVQFIHDFTARYSDPSKKRLAFGLAFPYNQNLTDIPGIYLSPVWTGLERYLEEQGVLSA